MELRARGARDASLGQSTLSAVTTNVTLYLQNAEPTAFANGHTTSQISPVVPLPANTYGYTVWDSTANRELFTVTFTDITTSTVTDPTGMAQLDHYEIGIQTPYSTIGWLPIATITGTTRLYATVDWASMVDSPFQLPASLPAQ